MSCFSIAAAQLAAVRGDVECNLENHVRTIGAAARQGVQVLVFPELSLTGYEPTLADALAFAPDDARLAPLVRLAREHHMTVIVGAPLAGKPQPQLGAIVISDAGELSIYAKIHLHPGEETFFSPGQTPLVLRRAPHAIGVAICADLGHASHPASYAELGATIYIAGVCLTAKGYAADAACMTRYARDHGMLTVLANYYGPTGNYQTAGRSAIWAPGGQLLAEASPTGDALVIARCVADRWTGEQIPLR
jgi:predicted amidohydrolase